MKREDGRIEPRYVERTEEVVFGLGGYFQMRLNTIEDNMQVLMDVAAWKKREIKRLPKNRVLRALKLFGYGDSLTDYETEQISELEQTKTKMAEILDEVTGLGRVDRAITILRETIAGCFAYLKSGVRESDSIGRSAAQANIWLANDSIEALMKIEPDEAAGYADQLIGLSDHERFWQSGI